MGILEDVEIIYRIFIMTTTKGVHFYAKVSWQYVIRSR